MTDDELLTAAQAGAVIRRSGRTVRRMADAGAIPIAHKVSGPNGAYLFKRADVEQLLEQLEGGEDQ